MPPASSSRTTGCSRSIPALASRYNIRSIPTLMLLAGGRPVARTAGAMDTQHIVSWVRSQSPPEASADWVSPRWWRRPFEEVVANRIARCEHAKLTGGNFSRHNAATPEARRRTAMISVRELRPLGDTLGTEAIGIDLSQPLDAETFAWVEDAFAEHPVLVFREQNLGPAELAAFGRRFGKPKIHSLVDYRHVEHPEVSWLTNVDKDGNIDWFGVKRATDWHTDSPYEEVPPRLAILHAKEVPSSKGGTMFADMRAAYDALSDAMKERLAGMTGLHGRHDGPAGVRLYEGDPEQNLDKEYPEKARPAVVSHPVTGRPILFVNPLHTHGFQGMAKDEAWQLIEELAAHSTQNRFVYYHSWRVGDLLMWDERATMHRGAGDYRPDERRIMLRTIVYPN